MSDVGAPSRKLYESHVEELRASGLNDETIALAGLFSEVRHKILAELLHRRFYATHHGAGLVFPFFRPGATEPHAYRIKAARPRVSGGKPVKYDQSSEHSVLTYFAPRARAGGWYDDASRALHWCEGEKKSLCLDQLGLTTIGLCGVWMFVDTAHKKASKQWRFNQDIRDYVSIADRDHVIVFDFSEPKAGRAESDVVAAARRLTRCLLDAGARSVRFITPPTASWKGIDDFCFAHGAEKTSALIAQAEEIKPATRVPESLKLADEPDGLSPLYAENLPPGVARESDLALAHLLCEHHGPDILHCCELGWVAWDGRRFVQDPPAVSRRAQNVARRLELGAADLFRQAAHAEGDDQKQLRARATSLAKWARTAQSAPGIRKAIELAATMVHVNVDQLDADPLLLNVQNGTIELATGTLREHRRTDRITMLASTAFDPSAEAPTWTRFQEEVHPDAQIRRFNQRHYGYSLTGDTREQCVIVCHGEGANGKSTEIEAIRAVLDAYVVEAAGETFVESKRGRSTDNKLADLRAARMVTTSESGESHKLNETLIKRVSGGDQLTANRLYRESFRFYPRFKLRIVTNHRPLPTGVDEGLWRRLFLIPYQMSFRGREDRELSKKLQAEAPGILRWLVDGCREWLRAGLQAPTAVTVATQAWRDDSDQVAGFIADRCVLLPESRTKATDLYAAFVAWCRTQGPDEHACTKQAFGKRLADRGLTPGRGNAVGRFWNGIGLIAEREPREYGNDFVGAEALDYGNDFVRAEAHDA